MNRKCTVHQCTQSVQLLFEFNWKRNILFNLNCNWSDRLFIGLFEWMQRRVRRTSTTKRLLTWPQQVDSIPLNSLWIRFVPTGRLLARTHTIINNNKCTECMHNRRARMSPCNFRLYFSSFFKLIVRYGRRVDESGTCLAVSILASEINVNVAFGAQTQNCLLVIRLLYSDRQECLCTNSEGEREREIEKCSSTSIW